MIKQEVKKLCNSLRDEYINKKDVEDSIIVIDLYGSDIKSSILKREISDLKVLTQGYNNSSSNDGYNISIKNGNLVNHNSYPSTLITDSIYYNKEVLRLFTIGYSLSKLFYSLTEVMQDGTFDKSIVFVSDSSNQALEKERIAYDSRYLRESTLEQNNIQLVKYDIKGDKYVNFIDNFNENY